MPVSPKLPALRLPAVTTTSVLQDHRGLRQRAATALLRLAELADEDGGTVTHQKRTVARGDLLRNTADKLANNAFVLAVVGEFSRGKSSLVNALLDQADLLPTALEPSTAAVTVISYAPEQRISVTFKDGTTREGLTPEELAAFASGQDLDGRQKRLQLLRRAAAFDTRVAANGLSLADVDLDPEAVPEEKGAAVHTVNVGLPAPFLRDGICLVDTPGIGSVNPEHGEATREHIHKADAVLFLVNTDPVISHGECDFLAFLKDYVQRFLFVVTKTDRFSPRERLKSVAYTRRTIEQFAGIPLPPIYPVSARLAQLGRSEPDEIKYKASGFPEFLDGLHAFLINARGKDFLGRNVRLALAQVQDLMNGVLLELQGLKMRLEDLPASIEETRLALAQGEVKRRQILQALEQRLRRVDAAMEAFSPTALVRLELHLAAEIERLVDGYDWDQLQRVAGTIPVFIRDLMATRLGPEFAAVAKQLVATREDILSACTDYFGEIGARLSARFTGLRLPERLTVSLDFDPDDLANRLQRIGTYTIGTTLALTVASVIAVGPVGALVVFGGLVARHTMTSSLRNDVKRRLKMSLTPAISKLLSDLFKNVRAEVDRSVTHFRQEVEDYLHGATSGIETKLTEMRRASPVPQDESSERQHCLHVRLAELDQIHAELSTMLEPEW